ncbi:hypothetical protein [Streptomyces sp. NPDC096339]|uniref:hypothetical protein n=1 Tax=Streptomyces sp. NPDC096339 TaxID=3366086 RepID=UPI00382220AE
MAALVAALAWACSGCANAGGEAAWIDQTELVGEWSNPGGASLHLGADRVVSGRSLHSAMLGGTRCPDAMEGHWSFYSPVEGHITYVDAAFTSGDHVNLAVKGEARPCGLSALIRRNGQGINLCLVEDPDSDCSAEELLHRVPSTSPVRTPN